MWARVPSSPDNFKRVIKYHTLRTSFHGGFESVARRIRIVSHNLSDKVILPQLFQIWRHFQSHPSEGDMLDVQLKQSKYTTSAENVNKLYNFVLKCVETEHLQVKLTMMVCPERAYKMFISSQTSVHSDSESRNNTDIHAVVVMNLEDRIYLFLLQACINIRIIY